MKFCQSSFKRFCTTLLAAVSVSAPALVMAAPFDWSATGHVTFVESTYIPNSSAFTLDTSAGSCPAGSLLSYTGGAEFSAPGTDLSTKQQNITAVYASVMASVMVNKTITIYGYNAGCSVQFVHLNPN
jgi:hypothetical protein